MSRISNVIRNHSIWHLFNRHVGHRYSEGLLNKTEERLDTACPNKQKNGFISSAAENALTSSPYCIFCCIIDYSISGLTEKWWRLSNLSTLPFNTAGRKDMLVFSVLSQWKERRKNWFSTCRVKRGMVPGVWVITWAQVHKGKQVSLTGYDTCHDSKESWKGLVWEGSLMII